MEHFTLIFWIIFWPLSKAISAHLYFKRNDYNDPDLKTIHKTTVVGHFIVYLIVIFLLT